MSRILLLSVLLFLVGCEDKPVETPPECPQECNISTSGLILIKQFEGFVPYVYDDAAGLETIGYGHLIKQGESFEYITPEEGEELLMEDVKQAEKAVRKLVTVPITQGQYDSLVSFTFNLGASRLKSSTLLRKLNNGEDASEEFQRWVYAGGKKLTGLVLRREAEAYLFRG